MPAKQETVVDRMLRKYGGGPMDSDDKMRAARMALAAVAQAQPGTAGVSGLNDMLQRNEVSGLNSLALDAFPQLANVADYQVGRRLPPNRPPIAFQQRPADTPGMEGEVSGAPSNRAEVIRDLMASTPAGAQRPRGGFDSIAVPAGPVSTTESKVQAMLDSVAERARAIRDSQKTGFVPGSMNDTDREIFRQEVNANSPPSRQFPEGAFQGRNNMYTSSGRMAPDPGTNLLDAIRTSGPNDPTGLAARMSALAKTPETGFSWQEPISGPAQFSRTRQTFGTNVPPDVLAQRSADYLQRINDRKWAAYDRNQAIREDNQALQNPLSAARRLAGMGGGEGGDAIALSMLGAPPQLVNALLESRAQNAALSSRERIADKQLAAQTGESAADRALQQMALTQRGRLGERELGVREAANAAEQDYRERQLALTERLDSSKSQREQEALRAQIAQNEAVHALEAKKFGLQQREYDDTKAAANDPSRLAQAVLVEAAKSGKPLRVAEGFAAAGITPDKMSTDDQVAALRDYVANDPYWKKLSWNATYKAARNRGFSHEALVRAFGSDFSSTTGDDPLSP